MARIVTSTYDYKRPPQKRKPLVDVPVSVTSVDPKKAAAWFGTERR